MRPVVAIDGFHYLVFPANTSLGEVTQILQHAEFATQADGGYSGTPKELERDTTRHLYFFTIENNCLRTPKEE